MCQRTWKSISRPQLERITQSNVPMHFGIVDQGGRPKTKNSKMEKKKEERGEKHIRQGSINNRKIE